MYALLKYRNFKLKNLCTKLFILLQYQWVIQAREKEWCDGADGWGKGKAWRRRLFTLGRCSNSMGWWLHAGERDEVTSLLQCPVRLCLSGDLQHTRHMCAKWACLKPRPHRVTESHGSPFQLQSSSREVPLLSLNWDFRCRSRCFQFVALAHVSLFDVTGNSWGNSGLCSSTMLLLNCPSPAQAQVTQPLLTCYVF